MVSSRALSYIRIWLAALACMGAVPGWGCVHSPQLNCLVSPGLNNAEGDTNADAVWRTAGADEGLRQAFEGATYSMEDSGHGTYRGVNLGQRLTFEFDGREARLSHPEGSVNFHLTGYGYGDRLLKPERATLTGNGNRLEYRRGDLTEWYLNGSQGLEQGFTLAHRPGTNHEAEPLVIALAVTGALQPSQKADEDSVLFESGKGVVLRYEGLRALDARGRILPSRLQVRGREIRLIIEDHSALYPLIVDPLWTQQPELTATDGAASDSFGYSVSVSGDTAVIGARGKNGFQGAVYVFVRSGGVWSQQQELTAIDGAASDNFGYSVSVSGDTAVIGAYGKNRVQGAAYVFVRRNFFWSQQQELTAIDGAASDNFGYSVSVSGDTAVIGAYGKNSVQGAAYVFVRSGGVWSQQQELTATDGAASDSFGYSVSLSGDTAVIGAYSKNRAQGAAYVFVGSGGQWSQQQELTASDGAVNNDFGYSVSVSGDTAVIGAWGKNNYRGAVYVFVRSGGVWSQQQELTVSNGAAISFGYSVSVSGDTAVIGAVNQGANGSQGAAYVFVQSNGVWSQQQELTASDGAANNYFGVSVSVSGDTAVIGAYGKTIGSNSAQGAAYVFVRPRLGANALLVGSAGGSSSVVLSYSGAWTATANDSFLHVSNGSTSGTGSGVIVFTYDAFTGAGTRTGALTIAGLTLTLTQAGTNYIAPDPVTTLVSSGLDVPIGVAVDGSGNVYIADVGNQAIKEWSAATQQATTLVSLGLTSPTGVALDGSGNVYIADYENNAIKEWSAATQQITTLVSSGLNSPFGVAVDGSGNVYIADYGNNAIKEWSAATQQVTTLVSSGLNSPRGVAVDGSGNVYFSDYGNNAIKEWSAATQQVTTLVSSGLNSPSGVAVDGAGNVYIADTFNSAIKEWSAATQQVTTLVSSGLNSPWGVAVDGSGNVYIADTHNNAIKEILYAFAGPASLTEPASAGSDVLLPVLPATTSLAGIFAPTSDQSWLTIGTIANGVINFSFTANTSSSSRVAHITELGQQIPVTQNGLTAQTITFNTLSSQPYGTPPFTVSATATSGLAVSFTSTTTPVCTVSGSTLTLAAVGTCTIQATQAGNSNYAAAAPVNQSFQVTQVIQGQAITFGTLANQVFGAAPFTVSATASSGLPVSFASTTSAVCTVDANASVTLVAAGTCTIQATQAGNAGYAAATPVNQSFQVTPSGLGANALLFGSAAGSSSVVLAYGGAWTATANDSFLHISAGISSGTGSGVVVFTYDAFTGTGTRTGTLTIAGLTLTVTQAGTNDLGGPGPVTTLVSSGLNAPYGVAVDGSGNVYFADAANNAIYEWSAATQQVTTLVSSGLNAPYGVAVDGAGNVYIADSGNLAIKEWSASTQQVTTLVSAGLSNPVGVAVDGSGNVYIADTNNQVIEEWSAATQQVTTLVSSGLNHPYGVAVDVAGNVYIADNGNNTLKEWNASTQQVTTLASPSSLNGYLGGLAVDGSGNVYIADFGRTAIEEWSASTGQVSASAVVPSSDNGSSAVTVDGSGNVYIVDSGNSTIEEFPNAFVGPASVTEAASAGSDALLQVLPATTSLAGIFAPTSDQNWLTIGTIASGVINFSFTANTSAARTAHITVLGQQITVTQNGLTAQTITFGALSNQLFGTAPFTISATASSGLPVSFNSQTTSVCTVSAATVTLVSAGTCTIQATQAGNSNYAAAAPLSQSFQVTPVIQSQAITFGALSNQVLGTAPFTVSATATSGLPVSFVSTTSAVCTVDANASVTLVAAGTCTIQATQAGNAGYAAATPVNQSFQVTPSGLGANALLVGSTGGISSVVLISGGAWTATANDSFLHISAGSVGGTGSGLVVFTYDAFTGTGTRTGTLTIAGLTLTVTQAGTNYIGPGPVTTLVSSGLAGPTGVAVDGPGNIYIADHYNNAIKEWSAATQQVTTLVSSALNYPFGVGVDGSGNVYIADYGNNAIKEWSASTQQVTTLVSSGLAGPTGVAVDGSGNVYIADSRNGAIKEWSASTQQVTTLVSSGLSQPYGVAVDGSGNVYIADTNNNAIEEWSAATQQVTTLVSSGLSQPYGVAVDGSGNVYIEDYGNNAIKEWSAATQQVITLVSGLNGLYGVAVDGSGNVYIADYGNSAIKEIPYAFVGPASVTEAASAGSDALLQVLPVTTSLAGIFAPTSDQGWLTIGTIASGVINFSFTANTTGPSRVAHITELGQQIIVTQNGLTAQTITFNTLANQPYGTAPFTVSATATSGLAVSFTSTTTPVCTVSGATVTLVASGTCTIQASQIGNTNYAAAAPVNQSFQVTQVIQSQAITFGALSNEVLGVAPFTISATATSGLPVSFATTTPAVCTVDANASVTLVAAGTCTIQATQAGNAAYAAATPINQSFQVTPSGLGANALLVGSATGSSSVELVSGGAWTATANDSFLHIAAGSVNGTGNGLVVFTYDAFTGAGTRTGTLTIAGLTLTVTQAGTNYIGPGPMTTLVSSGLSSPRGVAVDGWGNVYIADTSNSSITEWSAATQQVTTLVSSGLSNPREVAVDGSGNVYIADTGNNAIKEWSAATQQVTTLVSSGLNFPCGVGVDGSDNVYIADTSNNAIKEWSAATQQVTTLVSSGLNLPFGVTVDGSGNVYIADTNNNAIKEWSASTQQVTTLVSSGLHSPIGVAVDGSGNVYSADTSNNAIKEWSAATQQVTTLVSSGLSTPYVVAVDGSGNVYIADTGNAAIKEIPYAFAGPVSVTEAASAGSDALLPVLPATTSLVGIFTPTSDQSWLTIGTIASGVINFSFTANTSAARTAHITVLGQQITVTQNGLSVQTITFGALSNQLFGTAPFTVSATASSGLPVSFNSQTTSVCTVSAATVTLVSVGTCTIQATQAGNTNYAAAPTVNQSFQVGSAVSVTPASLTYGPTTVGTQSAAQTVTFKNAGGSAISMNTPTVSGDFTIFTNTCPSSLAGHTNCSLSIKFAPTQGGTRTGILKFTDSDGASPQLVPLSGTGIGASLAPTSATFTAQNDGTASTPAQQKTFTLTNLAASSINVSTSGFTGANPGDFSVVGGSCQPLPHALAALPGPGNSCTFIISMTPSVNGAESATFSVTDDGGTQSALLKGTGIGAATSPTAWTYAAQDDGTVSSGKTFTFTNYASSALAFSYAFTGANRGDFPIQAASTCPTLGGSLPANSNCAFTVSFAPTANGAEAATFIVTDGDGSQAVALKGTGVGAAISPTAWTYAAQDDGTVSSGKTFTFTNYASSALAFSYAFTGANRGDFPIQAASTCPTLGGSLPANSNCTFTVSFAPTANGAEAATFTVTDADGSQAVALKGTGVGAAISPTAWTYAAQDDGTVSAGKTFTFTNYGSSALAFSYAFTGANRGDFPIQAASTCPTLGGSLPANSNCTFTVSFAPTANGAEGATFTVADADGNQAVALKGTGVGAAISPTAWTYAAQDDGTVSAGKTFTFTNYGSSASAFTYAFTGANPGEFPIVAATSTCPTLGGSLPANSNCTFTVSFAPTANGAEAATFTVTDADGSQAVALKGTGVGAAISPTAWTYAAQDDGTVSAGKTFTFTNYGSSGLAFSYAFTGANRGDFPIQAASTCPTLGGSLPANSNCTFTVSFAPTANGAEGATFTVADADGNQAVALKGTGVGAAISPTAWNFGTITVGMTSATKTFTFTNYGSSPQAFSAGFTGTDTSDFPIQATSTCRGFAGTLPANTSCTYDLKFAPTTPARTESATFSITDTDGMQSATLSSKGI